MRSVARKLLPWLPARSSRADRVPLFLLQRVRERERERERGEGGRDGGREGE